VTPRPTIDTELRQISEEIETLRRKLLTYMTKREEQRHLVLLLREAKLRSVIQQRNKEHEEPTR
jgi:hypothetical protein